MACHLSKPSLHIANAPARSPKQVISYNRRQLGCAIQYLGSGLDCWRDHRKKAGERKDAQYLEVICGCLGASYSQGELQEGANRVRCVRHLAGRLTFLQRSWSLLQALSSLVMLFG